MLKPLHIIATQSNPEVLLDKENNLFLIKGDILPEDSFEFFNPIFKWLSQYKNDPNPETIIEFDISIINTSSTRRLVTFFQILEKFANETSKVTIKWIYLSDDEIMQYAAYEFSKAFKKLKFITHAK